jgi:SEC-C motif-containing protein
VAKRDLQTPACPCGSGKAYCDCCEPLHRGAPADSAEALMRSRYAAFALGLADYIQSSWHPSTRPPPQSTEAGPQWIGLAVKRHEPIDAEHAVVEFVARYKINGRAHALREISRFVREDGRWFYVDGVLA